MSLRVAQVHPVLDSRRRSPAALLDQWWTVRDIATATARAGATVAVFQPHHLSDLLVGEGVSYHFVAASRPTMPRRLAAAVHDWAPDVVHLHGFETPFVARALGLLRAPLLVQDHASQPGRRLRRWGYRRTRGATFTALTQADGFLVNGELPATTQLFAIPENSSRFMPGDRVAARAQTGVFGDPALLWVGHLDANKDPLTLLRAVQTLLPRLPAIQLWCAFGNAPLLGEVEALLAADPDLAARVHLFGRVPHERIERLARACDLFVAASHREGSGYALIEALACGLTPVVSDIPSFRALTGDGAIGALVPVGDIAGFAAAIAGTQAQSRAQVRDHFDRTASFDVIGDRLVSAYRALLR